MKLIIVYAIRQFLGSRYLRFPRPAPVVLPRKYKTLCVAEAEGTALPFVDVSLHHLNEHWITPAYRLLVCQTSIGIQEVGIDGP
jgi:hypothetical protein